MCGSAMRRFHPWQSQSHRQPRRCPQPQAKAPPPPPPPPQRWCCPPLSRVWPVRTRCRIARLLCPHRKRGARRASTRAYAAPTPAPTALRRRPKFGAGCSLRRGQRPAHLQRSAEPQAHRRRHLQKQQPERRHPWLCASQPQTLTRRESGRGPAARPGHLPPARENQDSRLRPTDPRRETAWLSRPKRTRQLMPQQAMWV